MKILMVDIPVNSRAEVMGAIRQSLQQLGFESVSVEAASLEDDTVRSAAALELIESMARMTKDGERLLPTGEIQEDDGEAGELSSDDAVDTLHSLISAARSLAKQPPTLLEQTEGTRCTRCGESWVGAAPQIRINAGTPGERATEGCDTCGTDAHLVDA